MGTLFDDPHHPNHIPLPCAVEMVRLGPPLLIVGLCALAAAPREHAGTGVEPTVQSIMLPHPDDVHETSHEPLPYRVFAEAESTTPGVPFFGSYDGADDVIRMNHDRRRRAWELMTMLQPISTPLILLDMHRTSSGAGIETASEV